MVESTISQQEAYAQLALQIATLRKESETLFLEIQRLMDEKAKLEQENESLAELVENLGAQLSNDSEQD